MYTQEDIIYLAGLFDGDGTVSVSLQDMKAPWRAFPTLLIANNEIDVMEWLNLRFQGRVRAQRGKAHEFIFATTCDDVMKAMLPYLIIKKKDMEHAIAMRIRGNDKSPMTTEEKIDRMWHAAKIYEEHQGRRRSGSIRGHKRYDRLIEAIQELGGRTSHRSDIPKP